MNDERRGSKMNFTLEDLLTKPCAALNKDLLGAGPIGDIPTAAIAHAASKRTPLEKALLRNCENELSRRGIVYLHLSPMARERIGWPDLVCVVRGVPWAVELKSATGKTTPEQEIMLAAMAANGWRTLVCRDYDTFRKEIFSE